MRSSHHTPNKTCGPGGTPTLFHLQVDVRNWDKHSGLGGDFNLHSIPLTGDKRNWDRCRGTGGDYYLHSIPLKGDVRGTGDNMGPVTF